MAKQQWPQPDQPRSGGRHTVEVGLDLMGLEPRLEGNTLTLVMPVAAFDSSAFGTMADELGLRGKAALRFEDTMREAAIQFSVIEALRNRVY